VRVLDRLRVAERAGEVDVGAMEVERLGLCPQPPDDCSGVGEVLHGVTEVVVGQAVCLVFAAGQRGPARGPRGHEIPVESVLSAPPVVLFVQVIPAWRTRMPLVMCCLR